MVNGRKLFLDKIYLAEIVFFPLLYIVDSQEQLPGIPNISSFSQPILIDLYVYLIKKVWRKGVLIEKRKND